MIYVVAMMRVHITVIWCPQYLALQYSCPDRFLIVQDQFSAEVFSLYSLSYGRFSMCGAIAFVEAIFVKAFVQFLLKYGLELKQIFQQEGVVQFLKDWFCDMQCI
jgi:hypothetical protein